MAVKYYFDIDIDSLMTFKKPVACPEMGPDFQIA